MQADGAGVEAADLEEVLDEALEAADVARQQVERGLGPLGHLLAAGLHHLDRRRQRHQRRAQLVADVGREAGVALDAQLQRRRHVVERPGEHAEVGVVARRQAGAEVAAGDRLGGLRRLGDRPHGAAGGEDAEQHAEQRRDDAGEEQREGDVGQRLVGLAEVEELEVGADARAAGCRTPSRSRRRPRRSCATGVSSSSDLVDELGRELLVAEAADARRPRAVVVDDRPLHAELVRAARWRRRSVGRLGAQLAQHDLGVAVGGLRGWRA